MRAARLLLTAMLLWSLPVASLLAASPAEGQGVYRQHCKRCHGADGSNRLQGKVDFTLGEGLVRQDRVLKKRIERGKGFCPAYLGVLSTEDIYNVIAYLRTFQ